MRVFDHFKKGTRPEAGEGESSRVLVWDIPVRLFHWSLVATVGIAAVTGFLAPEWWLDVHVWSGYAIGILIMLRIVWGFTGSRYARFSSFSFSFKQTMGYLGALVRRRAKHYTGHNPAGAVMVFALLGVLGAITISGLVVLGGQENQGMLAGFVSYATGDAAEEVHEFLAIMLLFMIGAHVLGVVVESRLGGENLVRAMISGRKKAKNSGNDDAQPASYSKALVSIAAIAIATGAGLWAARDVPPSGFAPIEANAAYASECGDCHVAYHPSLLPASSWRRIMHGLGDHFGEDASLDEQSEKTILAYLENHAAERWDTEAANNFRRLSGQDPLSITATPYWKTRHKKIAKTIFASRQVGSKGNCNACHKDAETGHFDDQMIAIPQYLEKTT